MHVPALLHVKRACVFLSRSIRSGYDCDDFVGNSLVNMYAKCG
jgi:hypothetical protein